VLICNGSTDGTVDAAREKFPHVEVLELSWNAPEQVAEFGKKHPFGRPAEGVCACLHPARPR
jgi:hypothetical protein